MTDGPTSHNYLYSWDDGESSTQHQGDGLVLTDLSESGQIKATAYPVDRAYEEYPTTPNNELPATSPEDGLQWSKEREQAIEEALEALPIDSTPLVHAQILGIIDALKRGTLAKPYAEKLLKEVTSYLSTRLKREESLALAAHIEFQHARESKLNALLYWQQASHALIAYLDNDDPLHLRLAQHACEQAHHHMEHALETLLSIELDDKPTNHHLEQP